MSAILNTRSGKLLDLEAPSAKHIAIEDIASGLAMVPRFGAQSRFFYSVAQHAVSVAHIVEGLGRSDLALAALHHDSHEAYACDLPTPLKNLLRREYEPITVRLDKAISDALHLQGPESSSPDGELIKEADNAAFNIEAEMLLQGEYATQEVGDEAAGVAKEVVGAAISSPWGPAQGRDWFLAAHRHARLIGAPLLRVPSFITSDIGDGEAHFVHLVPDQAQCERIVFASRDDEPDPGGYLIPLSELRADPARWSRHLAEKRTAKGEVPAVRQLAQRLAELGPPKD